MAEMKLETLLTLKDRASKQLNKFRGNVSSTKSEIKSLVGTFGTAFAGGAVIRDLFETNKEFSRLRSTLQTFTDSAKETDTAFDFVKDIASDLPESVDDITTSFIRMKSLGLAPTREALTSFSNTAAASGKNILDFVEAVADASTGEFERLKEFGIKARKEGEQVALTFQGQTEIVENSSAAITEYLQNLGDNQFAGAATRQMDELVGLTSNLGDSWDQLLTKFGEQGANDAFKFILRTGIDALNFLSDGVTELKVDFISLFGAVELGGEIIKAVGQISSESFKLTWQKAIAVIQETWNKFINSLKNIGNSITNKLGFGEVFKTVDVVEKKFESYASVVKRVDAELDKTSKSIKDNVDEMIRQARATGTSEAELDKFNQKLKDEQAEALAAAKAEKALALARENAELQLKRLNKEKQARSRRGESIRLSNRTEQEIFSETKAELDSLKKTGDITEQTYTRALAKATESLNKFKDDAKEDLSDVTEFAKEAARGIENNFSDFFFDVMQGNFDDLGTSFKRTIDRMVADFLASKLAGFLFGDFGSGSNSLGGLFGSLFQGAFADGGNVQANRVALVGERGPELFVPKSAGSIVSNDDLITSSNNNFNLTINALDSKDVLTKLEEIKRPLSEMINGANNIYNLNGGLSV